MPIPPVIGAPVLGCHQPSSTNVPWSAAPQCRFLLWRSHLRFFLDANASFKQGGSAASEGGTEVSHSKDGLRHIEKTVVIQSILRELGW